MCTKTKNEVFNISVSKYPITENRVDLAKQEIFFMQSAVGTPDRQARESVNDQASVAEDLEELANQEMEDRIAVRPSACSFIEPTAEFFRWYEYGGKPRLEPLTREALLEVLKTVTVTNDWNNAFSIEEWERFKNRKLGLLKLPLHTLQSIVQEHGDGTDTPCWEVAREVADWCRTATRPKADEVYAALDGLIVYAEHEAKTNSGILTPWYQQAVDERNFMERNIMLSKHEADENSIDYEY
jgi:hypothetical protein